MSNDEVLAAAGWTMQELLEAALLPWSPMPKKETTEDVSKRGAVNDNQDDDLVYVTERLEQQCISVDLPESNTRFDRKENTPSRNSATRPTLKCEQLAYPLPQAKPSIQCVPESCHLDETLQNGLKLFPHQKEAVLKAVELQRVILAYDMGLGKTLISLVWAQEMLKRFPNCIVVVLCPCTLTENWKRESSSLGFQSAEDLLSPVSSKGPELFISSWAKIPEVREINEKTGGRYSGYLAIFDESHYMQCLRSQRTQTALNLALHPSCRGLILATGTPMKNGRPCNILPLLMAIRHPIARDKMEFEKRYCDAKKTRFCAWDTSGAKNLDELKKRIGPYMLRKTKDECMKDSLPQLSRVEHRIIVSSEALAEYRAIVEEMRLKSKAFHSSGSGSYRQDSSALEALSALRQLSSNAKVAPTALLVVQKLKELGHVVVFAWFKETAHNLSNEIKISSHYSCEVLTGDLNYVERQRLVDNFQAGKLNVLICTYGVGAVGLTLTKSSLVVLLDRPWTPGDVMQAEDRVRRIGQSASTVESIWISGFDLDNKLDDMLLKKLRSSERVLANCDGIVSQEPEWFKESQADLLKAILSETSKTRAQKVVSKASVSEEKLNTDISSTTDIRTYFTNGAVSTSAISCI